MNGHCSRVILSCWIPSVWDGYFSDFDRNFAIGYASDAAHLAHQQLYDATEAALAVAKPGKTPADLYAAMDKVLRPDASSGGGDDVGRYGHGLGIQLTEPPSHTAWDHTELAANMVLTLEPSVVYGDEFLMVAEEKYTDHRPWCRITDNTGDAGFAGYQLNDLM